MRGDEALDRRPQADAPPPLEQALVDRLAPVALHALVTVRKRLRVGQQDVPPREARPALKLRPKLAVGMPRVDHEDIGVPRLDEQVVSLLEEILYRMTARHGPIQKVDLLLSGDVARYVREGQRRSNPIHARLGEGPRGHGGQYADLRGVLVPFDVIINDWDVLVVVTVGRLVILGQNVLSSICVA